VPWAAALKTSTTAPDDRDAPEGSPSWVLRGTRLVSRHKPRWDGEPRPPVSGSVEYGRHRALAREANVSGTTETSADRARERSEEVETCPDVMPLMPRYREDGEGDAYDRWHDRRART
jgi:hypothetical protein